MVIMTRPNIKDNGCKFTASIKENLNKDFIINTLLAIEYNRSITLVYSRSLSHSKLSSCKLSLKPKYLRNDIISFFNGIINAISNSDTYA